MVGEKFIRTISDFEKNQTAKRKGDAFELLIGYTLREGSDVPVETQITIKKAITEYCKRIYMVHKQFQIKLQNGTLKKYRRSYQSECDEKETFDKNDVVFQNDLQLNYTKHFKKKKKVIERTFQKGNELVRYLVRCKLVYRIIPRDVRKKFRLDFCRIVEGKLCIIESKNKEKTYLEERDLNQIVVYGSAIMGCGILGYIQVPFNGYSINWSGKLAWILKERGIEIRLIPIRNWLLYFTYQTGMIIDCLVFSKVPIDNFGFLSIKASTTSKLYLNMHLRRYENFTEYKPVDLLISDDMNRIEEFLQQQGFLQENRITNIIYQDKLIGGVEHVES